LKLGSKKPPGISQTRNVSKAPLKPAHSMRDRSREK
jgi:hypothetical protein